MRIGIIIEHYDPNAGGAERWAAGFAQYLLNAGHEVHIFTFKCDLDIAPLILHLMPEPGTLIGRAEIVEKCVAPFRPMVLQDYGTGWSADVFHPQTGSRLLCVKQDLAAQANKGIAASLSPRTLWRHHLMDQIERRAMRNAKKIVALSSRLQTLLSARHHLPAERVRLVPNGIDSTRFTQEKLSPLREPFRTELGLGDSLVCAMAAYNLRLKGLETALRAIAIAARQNPRICLVVAGSMPDEPMRQLIAELGLGDKIHFLGGIAVENLYAAADVFVHPTRWDACSLVTLEAMASALPVITTIMDGSSERITDGADGFVLPRPKGPSIAGATPVGAERPGDAAARRRRRPQTSRNRRAPG